MQSTSFEWSRRKTFILLAIFSATVLAGLVTGSFLASRISTDTVELIRSLPDSGVTGAALLLLLFIPLAFTGLAVFFQYPPTLLVLLFIKLLFYSFCSCCLLVSFPDSGWLLRALILFSDSMGVIVYLWLWLKAIVFHSLHPKTDLPIGAFLLFLIWLLDITVISPFTASLFIH